MSGVFRTTRTGSRAAAPSSLEALESPGRVRRGPAEPAGTAAGSWLADSAARPGPALANGYAALAVGMVPRVALTRLARRPGATWMRAWPSSSADRGPTQGAGAALPGCVHALSLDGSAQDGVADHLEDGARPGGEF